MIPSNGKFWCDQALASAAFFLPILIQSFRRARKSRSIASEHLQLSIEKTKLYLIWSLVMRQEIFLKIEIRINPQFIYPRDPGSPNLRMVSWNLKKYLSSFCFGDGLHPNRSRICRDIVGTVAAGPGYRRLTPGTNIAQLIFDKVVNVHQSIGHC